MSGIGTVTKTGIMETDIRKTAHTPGKMNALRLSFLAGVLIAISIILAGCAPVPYLKTEGASLSEPSGNYTLILFGGRYAADLQNVAILDKEGDPYTFEMYAPAFDYKIRHGVSAKEAIQDAERFVRFHYAVRNSQWAKILGPDGGVIGYEVRPLYGRLETGYPDILDITYVMSDKKVIVRISFIPEMERAISREDEGPFLFRRGR